MVRLIAVKPFSHRGRSYRAGEALTVSAIEAVALRRRGVAATPDSSTPATAKPSSRRRYNRRDLEAEE